MKYIYRIFQGKIYRNLTAKPLNYDFGGGFLMSAGLMLFSVIFTAFAVSYGWGVRGFIIGGEKGALLPGALMGMCIAVFTLGENAGNLWMFFAAAGALSTFYGGTETYAQTMSWILHRDVEGPYYNQVKKGVVGIFLKGGLWFAIPGLVLALLPSALSGKYGMWEIILLFALFPIVSVIGTKIFNSPYNKEKGQFPKIYFSLDRREEWGSNVLIIAVLLIFSLVKGDFFAVGAGVVGFIVGGAGFLIGLILFDVERRHGRKIFGKIWEKHVIDGWKIMEHAFGAIAGGGLMLYFAMFSSHITGLAGTYDPAILTMGDDSFTGAIVCFALLLVTTLQYPVIYLFEKKKGYEPDINIFEIIERPLWSAVPLILIFLGSYSAASFAAVGTLFFALCEKCALEKYEHSRFKAVLRAPFCILWLLLPVWFFIKIGNITMLDTMLSYTLGYTGACVMYTLQPDNIIALKKGEKTFAQAIGSGSTVTSHLVVQSIALVIFAAFCG